MAFCFASHLSLVRLILATHMTLYFRSFNITCLFSFVRLSPSIHLLPPLVNYGIFHSFHLSLRVSLQLYREPSSYLPHHVIRHTLKNSIFCCPLRRISSDCVFWCFTPSMHFIYVFPLCVYWRFFFVSASSFIGLSTTIVGIWIQESNGHTCVSDAVTYVGTRHMLHSGSGHLFFGPNTTNMLWWLQITVAKGEHH